MLIEDYPGVGKTALARALARSIDAEYARVQCTADLLPADVVGTNVFNQRENRFEFRPGPVFANVVLVDEVNRASPKTQSGLLECMQERHVTVDKHTHELARPVHGARHAEPDRVRGHLPAARGAARPLHGARLARLPARRRRRRTCSPTTASATACSTSSPWPTWARCSPPRRRPAPCTAARRCAATSSPISTATRADPRVELGASPRAGLMLFRAAKALAALDGRDHALPDDVQALAAVGAHPPAAARARAPAATSAPPWCATRSSGSRRSDAAAVVTRAIAAALLGARPLPGGRDVRLALAVRARAWRSSLLAAGAAALGRAGRPRRGRHAHARARPRSWRTSPTRCGSSCAPGLLPPPGGELIEPLLGWPVPIARALVAAGADQRALLAPRPARARARRGS